MAAACRGDSATRTWSYSKWGTSFTIAYPLQKSGKPATRRLRCTGNNNQKRTGLKSSSTKRRQIQEESERRHVHHIHITHSCTLREARRILGHALQAVAVERLIPVVFVKKTLCPEMIPHEETRAPLVSLSCAPAPVHLCAH